MILPRVRDPRLVTIRRGGSLTDDDHRALARWSADCAEHVLHLFERERTTDARARDAIAAVRSWAAGSMSMMDSRACGGHAMGAARDLMGAARFAAYSAGQAACVAHVPEHDLGAAAYAIKAAVAAAGPTDDPTAVRLAERDRQRAQLPIHLRELMTEDQARRNSICWNVFD